MPLMMEDEAYMEDLFGDSGDPVTIPALPQAPIKGLAQRLDELHESGCCQKIAWSKNGCVAYITPDGRNINLKAFYRDETTGKWDLGNDIALGVPAAHDEFPYTHILWSYMGSDLAVVDAAGRISIFNSTSALGRMNLARAHVNEPEDEMSGIVGMHWLNIIPHQQKNYISWSASGSGNDWNFKVSSHSFTDMHHPMENKAALISLARNGNLRLRFQQPDNTWQEASTGIEDMKSAKEQFSHAAFASNNDFSLLLAAHDVTGRLHLYNIKTKWTVPGPSKQGQPAPMISPPELRVAKLLIEDICYPMSSTSIDAELNGAAEQKIQIPAQLTHLNFLPTTPEQGSEALPTLQAVFSHPPNSVSFDQTQPQQSQFSIITRWEYHQGQQNLLHPSLDQVASKKKSVSSAQPKQTYRLKRLSDMPLHSLVLSSFPLWFNMILSFCYSDGTVEFRNRATMEAIGPNYNTETVTSLSQAGFAFSSLESSLHVSLSANHCMAVSMQSDGSIRLKSMEYTHGSLNTEEDDPKHAAAIAALVLQSTTAANQYFSNDDIFAVMGDVSEGSKRDFIHLLFRALNLNLDPTTDNDPTGNNLLMLGRSPNFAKGLSAANLLGLEPNAAGIKRNVPGKIAWSIINIKYVTQILTQIIRMHGDIAKNALQPQIAPSLIGLARWMIHFMTYVLDDLMTLGESLRGTPSFDRETLEAKIKEQATPALAILLSAFPRTMIKLWHQPLTWMSKTAFMLSQNSPQPEIRRIYVKLQQPFQDTAFDWRHFEQLIQEAHHLVRTCYQRQGFTEFQRGDVERQLMMGSIPDVLLPAAKRLLGPSLFDEGSPGGIMERIDPAKVMFFDTTWLGMIDSRHSQKWFNNNVVDVCQKIVVRGPNNTVEAGPGVGVKVKKGLQGLRRCTRCCAFMEDVTQGMPGYGHHHVSWLQGVAKHCVCSNPWMLLEEKN